MPLKRQIKDALLGADFKTITDLALKNNKIFRILISLAYDKEKLICWRAIEAMGKAAGAVAEKDPAAARNIVQRLLWSIRDESGGIGWGAPEMLGEIVRNSPKAFSDLSPVIFSFHDEEPFLKGILWAMGRMADAITDPVEGVFELAVECLNHKDPAVRGVAAWAAAKLNRKDSAGKIKALMSDEGKFKFYENLELREMTVGEMAQRVLDNRA